MHTLDYLEILTKLRAHREGWRKLDHRVSRSRFDTYERALLRLQQLVDNPSLAQQLKPEEVSDFYQMLPDVHEFNEVSEWLLSRYGPDFGERVRKVFSGPNMQSDEKNGSSGASRNTLFELLVASFVAQCGLPVDLTGITDVVTEFQSHRIVIECKRPLARSGAKSLARDAVKQLQRRFENGKGCSIGIIALSCSRAFTGGTLMAQGVSNSEVEAALSHEHDLLRMEIESEWRGSPFVDAVIFYSKVVGSRQRPELHGFVSAYENLTIGNPLGTPMEKFFHLMNQSISLRG